MKLKIFILFLLFYIVAESQEYKIIQTEEYASCANYTIYQKVEFPENIKNALECPPWVDISGNFLTIISNDSLLMYNFLTKQTTLLFKIYDDVDGVSAPVWFSDKSKIMFVIINQEKKHDFKSFARIIVITFNKENTISSTETFDKPVNFICGSLCVSMPGEDFYFIDNDKIAYKRNVNIDKNPGEIEIIKLKK